MKFSLADKAAGPLEQREIDAIFAGPHLLRLGLIDERDGSPLVHPVWFYYENEMFFLATNTDGRKASSLRKDPRVYFLVDIVQGPPRGIRGKGIARVSDDHDYAIEVTKKCAMKYLGTTETETAKR